MMTVGYWVAIITRALRTAPIKVGTLHESCRYYDDDDDHVRVPALSRCAG